MAMHARMVLLLVPLLGGCLETVATVGGVSVAAVPLIGRTLPDAVISTVAGKDCSLVRLDAGKSYCAPEEKPPEQPVVCTRSLGALASTMSLSPASRWASRASMCAAWAASEGAA